MRKTERLFAIMDSLRRHRRPVTAARLADELGVSARTIYRDVQTLLDLGARIDGEAGIGYLLRAGFFLPPLMFSREELETLVLGARWVQSQPDEELAAAASNALGKIVAASPANLRERIDDAGLWPGLPRGDLQPRPLLALLRNAMSREKALVMRYEDEHGSLSERSIWPINLAYYESKQIVAAWCCLREGFRHFRVDRIADLALTDDPYGKPRRTLEREWWTEWLAEHSDWHDDGDA